MSRPNAVIERMTNNARYAGKRKRSPPTTPGGEGECRWTPVDKAASLPLHPGVFAVMAGSSNATWGCQEAPLGSRSLRNPH